MFPKVTTEPLDMELQVRNYMDDIAAEEWCEGYLDKEAFLGSYCNGLIWLRKLSPYIIIHELNHHMIECLKNKLNSIKPDILHCFNEVINAMVQKNWYVFYVSLKEIREILNF
jgi:hypothetical protein